MFVPRSVILSQAKSANMKRSSVTDATKAKKAKVSSTSTPSGENGQPSPPTAQNNAVSAATTSTQPVEVETDSAKLLTDKVAAFRAKIVYHLMTSKTTPLGVGYYIARDLESINAYLKAQLDAVTPSYYHRDPSLIPGFTSLPPLHPDSVGADEHHLKSWEVIVRTMSKEDMTLWRKLSEQSISRGIKWPKSPEYTKYYNEMRAKKAQEYEKAQKLADSMTNLVDEFRGKEGEDDDDDAEQLSDGRRKKIPELLWDVWESTRDADYGSRLPHQNKEPLTLGDIKRLMLKVMMFGVKEDQVMIKAARMWAETQGVKWEGVEKDD